LKTGSFKAQTARAIARAVFFVLLYNLPGLVRVPQISPAPGGSVATGWSNHWPVFTARARPQQSGWGCAKPVRQLA